MSQGFFFVMPGFSFGFSPLGVGKQGVGMEHPVPLQQGCRRLGQYP